MNEMNEWSSAVAETDKIRDSGRWATLTVILSVSFISLIEQQVQNTKSKIFTKKNYWLRELRM